MPSHRTHRKVDRFFLNEEHDEVHRWMDAPVRQLGPRHRILRHSFEEIANRYYDDPHKFLSAYFHLVADFSNSDMKRRARAAGRKKKRKKGGKKHGKK